MRRIPPKKALQPAWPQWSMWAHMLDVVVLPWVPAKQMALEPRVIMPRAAARLMMLKPPLWKNVRGVFEAGTAGVYITSVSAGLRKASGTASMESSYDICTPSSASLAVRAEGMRS